MLSGPYRTLMNRPPIRARTNIILWSQVFESVTFTKDGFTISVDAAVAHDGTTTADKLVETATTAEHRLYHVDTRTAAVTTHSVFCKSAGRDWAYIRLANVPGLGAWFNLANGVIGTVEAGITARIYDYGSGWYRCCVTATTTVATWYSMTQAASADNVTTYLGDITKGIYAWGDQLELGPLATPYIYTEASAVTVVDDLI